MEHIRDVLQAVCKGRVVGPEAMAAALNELDEVEARLADRVIDTDKEQLVFLSPESTPLDESHRKLADIFLVLEQFMFEMHAKGAFRSVTGPVADAMIGTSRYLRLNHVEFPEPRVLRFKPVVADR